MDKYLKIEFSNDLWSCELWQSETVDFAQCEDFVTAPNFQALLVAIGNKDWIELLTKT